MKGLKISICFITMFAFVACVTTTKITSISNRDKLLETNKIIYIMPIDNGTYNGKIYQGSGQSVSLSFLQHLKLYASDVIVGKSTDGYTNEVDYIVEPIIKHWEPRAAAWSGIPTRVEIMVTIKDAKSNEVLTSRLLSIKGRSFTFTNQSAEGLAGYIINDFCGKIFEK